MTIAMLIKDRKGVAAVEFALFTALFFAIILTALDFGSFFIQRSRAGEAISAASISAFDHRDSVPFATLPELVRQYGRFPAGSGLAVDIRCNGTSGCANGEARQCACLGTNGFQVANSCGSPCSGTGMTKGSTAGYYLTIESRSAFRPVLMPRSLLPDTISEKATVRLQ